MGTLLTYVSKVVQFLAGEITLPVMRKGIVLNSAVGIQWHAIFLAKYFVTRNKRYQNSPLCRIFQFWSHLDRFFDDFLPRTGFGCTAVARPELNSRELSNHSPNLQELTIGGILRNQLNALSSSHICYATEGDCS